jgi:threonine/homoserine/homoserine lactone efflux protein
MAEIATALAVGFGAGISPGPLLALVLTSTLERGFGAGLRVALAPLVTDAPIVAAAVAVVGSVDSTSLRALGITGGVVVIGLGGHTLWAAGRPPSERELPASYDLWRGVVVNLLNPHPWVFWFTAGAPLLVAAWRRSPLVALLFLMVFYGMLVGSKVVVAWVVARGGRRLTERWRRRLLTAGGLALVAGGGALLWQAIAGRL